MKTKNWGMRYLFAEALGVAAILLMASSAPTQNLFVSDWISGNIYEFTNGAQSTFASGLNGPRGLAFNSAGDLFEADWVSGNIYEFTTNGQSTFASGLDSPYGLAFDRAGDLFEADDASGKIYEFATNGMKSTFASGLNEPTGLAFDSAGDLFAADQSSGSIYEFATNGMKSTFASGLDTPLGLAFNSAGNLFEADYHSGKIYEFTTNGVPSTFASGLDNPEGLAFDSAGDLFETDEASGNIHEFTTNGVPSIFASGVGHPSGVAVQPSPITIISDLTNTSVVLSSNTSFSVSATSSAPLTYQWYFNPANNSGQASAYASCIDGFVYGVVVTNGGLGYGNVPAVSFVGGGGSGASGYATISNGILTGITVTNAGLGYSTAPTVVIGPPDGLVYGQTNSTLNITNASTNDLGNYFVVVSGDGYSVTSSVVSVVLLYPAFIVNQPQDVDSDAHGNAAFSVTAGGTAPFTYEWQFNDSNLADGTNSTLIVSDVTQSNLGSYSVIVGNAYGSITSSVANLYMYPYIVTPFTGLDTYWGLTNELSVDAWGTGPLNYQWYDDGIAIADATNQTFTLSSIQFTNAGLYTVVVSGALGSVTNTPEEVVVNPAGVSLSFSPTLTISGVVGQSYIIESSTNLANPNAWITLTNLTLTQPVQIWVDTSVNASSPFNPSHFYQILPGP